MDTALAKMIMDLYVFVRHKQNISIFMLFTTCPYLKQIYFCLAVYCFLSPVIFSQHSPEDHIRETDESLSSKKP